VLRGVRIRGSVSQVSRAVSEGGRTRKV